MSPRLAGAALALIAAALLAASVVGVPWAWWDGHPALKGETIKAKTVHVGPLTAQGCNTGGDNTCSKLSLSGGFTTTGRVEAGVCGVLALAAVVLALLALADNERRKQLGKVVIGIAAVAAVGAVVMIILGPKVTTAQVSIPIGPGMGVFWVAIVGSMLGSVLAMRPNPPLVLRSAPPLGVPAAPPVDLAALMQQDQLRPASLGPEPMIGRPPPSPGGMLPGPAGPLGPPQAPYPPYSPQPPAPAPLFAAAPQLRPLYEAAPPQGGTAGFVPPPPAPLPLRAPTPVPRGSLSHLAGPPLPSPPPLQPPGRPSAPPTTPFVRPDSAMATADAAGWSLGEPAARSAPALPTDAPARPGTTRGAAMPPDPQPSRAKPASVAPPPPRTKPASLAPPLPARPAASPSTPPPPGARTKAASVAPPPRPTPSPLNKSTIAAAVVPPPAAPTLPIRAESDPGDHLPTSGFEPVDAETHESFDARATVARDDGASAGDIGDHTDASVQAPELDAAIGDHTDASLPLPPAPRPGTASDLIETRERAKQESIELPLATGDSTSPETAPTAAPERAADAKEPKIPVSTAPESLPPPEANQVASSGPSPACPQCEAPMAWVEEHLRFYCKSCRMYF